MIAVSADFSEAAARLFWSRVNKTDDCWLWTGPTNGRYGRIGRRTYAHRMAYELHEVQSGRWPALEAEYVANVEHRIGREVVGLFRKDQYG